MQVPEEANKIASISDGSTNNTLVDANNESLLFALLKPRQFNCSFRPVSQSLPMQKAP
jgi:hypothetical protein